LAFQEQLMNTSDEHILAAGRQRSIETPMAYAGAVTPGEAFALLSANTEVLLVDVRTGAERDWVGRVDIAEAQHAAIEWNGYPGGERNTAFIDQLHDVTSSQQQVLLFLCRSGIRSRGAAALATASGFGNCFDILEGFEGDKDGAGHRKSVGGWCAAGLPWIGA
jgi:rhodanese-related sulfurtransferase